MSLPRREKRSDGSSSEESKLSEIFSDLSVLSSESAPVPPKHTISSVIQENPEESDEEVDSLATDLVHLDLRVFDPVWVNTLPVHKELSEEVQEIVSGWANASQMIGSMKTILHLMECHDLVSLIDDPACGLEDEIITVPQGISPQRYILQNYGEGLVPYYFFEKHGGLSNSLQTVPVFPVFEVPSAITETAQPHRIQNIFPDARPQCFPDSVRMVHLKRQKSFDKFAAAVNKAFGDDILNKPELSFRGLGLKALALSLTFFLPVISSSGSDNEFGPGIYTSHNFKTAHSYAAPNGAIMVFDKIDARDLDVWKPTLDEWNQLVARWLALPLNNITISPAYKHADIVVGPISLDQGEARREKTFPKQDMEISQSAYVSYKSCERLMASLVAIIFVSR